MISDNERREVARKIRETGEELGSSALLWYHIAKALEVRTATDGKTACGMLADLIEPSGHECVPGECPINVRHDSEPEDFYRVTYSRSAGGSPYMLKVHSAKGDEWDFWRIDYDALLALADELDRMGDGSMYDPCISEEYGIARRIREALGVE